MNNTPYFSLIYILLFGGSLTLFFTIGALGWVYDIHSWTHFASHMFNVMGTKIALKCLVTCNILDIIVCYILLPIKDNLTRE